MLYATIFLAALPLILVLLVFILHWAADLLMYPRAVAAFRALGLPADVQGAAIACFDRAREADRSVRFYSSVAPIVVPIALLFTPRAADRLPSWASKWDNNVSINGDSGGTLLPDGTWLQYRDTPADRWPELVGLLQCTYDDPRYEGDAYYCRGRHPRSFLARWVWLGFRNRCSQLSVERGVTVACNSIETLAGDAAQDLSTARMGAFVARSGDAIHYKEHSKLGPFVLVRSLGYKLGTRKDCAGCQRACAVVFIPCALKRYKGN